MRNRLKVEAAVKNARGDLATLDERGSFGHFLWQFVDGRTRQNARLTLDQLPAQTVESQAMSKALRAYGFNFVGPTICYAFMQAVGMDNDHLVTCFRHAELQH